MTAHQTLHSQLQQHLKPLQGKQQGHGSFFWHKQSVVVFCAFGTFLDCLKVFADEIRNQQTLEGQSENKYNYEKNTHCFSPFV